MVGINECTCLDYNDKIKIIGALHDEKEKLEKLVSKSTSEALSKKFKNVIIPEYSDLIERVDNTPDCARKFEPIHYYHKN